MLRTKVTNLGMFIALRLAKLAKNGHFGHSGQSVVSENGPNEFLMPQNLGIDTKNKSLAGSEPKLQVWPCYLILTGRNGQKMASLATQVNLGCLKMVPMDFSYPKT